MTVNEPAYPQSANRPRASATSRVPTAALVSRGFPAARSATAVTARPAAASAASAPAKFQVDHARRPAGDLIVITSQIRLRPDVGRPAAGPPLRESGVAAELSGPARRGLSGTIIRMRRSDWSRAEAELPTASVAAADGAVALGDRAPPCRDLATRLARMPDAHPAAWSAAHRAGETDAWWRGESDAWWRGPDPSGDEHDGDDDDVDDSDDIGGPGGGFGGIDDASITADEGGGDAASAGRAGESDARPGSNRGRATQGRASRQTTGPARSDHRQPDGGWKPRPGQAGPGQELYRPWFSAGGAAVPWFATGPDQYGPAG